MSKIITKDKLDSLTCYIDLHLHLDGAISVKIAKKLAALQGIELPDTDADLRKKMRVSPDCSDLNEFLEKFEFPCSLLQTKEGITAAVKMLLEELHEKHVMYAEIRFAPQKSTGKGLTQEEVVKAAIEGLQGAKTMANFILCLMRGNDNKKENLETIEVAKKFLGKGVVAIDLAGAEALFPTKDFKEEFEVAAKEGIPFTIHAGEAAGPDSIKCALDMGAKRIGHGIASLKDDAVVKELIKKRIPLEICPTSNVNTAIFKSLNEYPLRKLMDAGLIITINTDDPSIEGTSLRREFKKMAEVCSLTESEVKEFLINAADAAFADDSVKETLKTNIRALLR